MKKYLSFSLGIIMILILSSFILPKKKKKIAAPDGMSYIPSGTFSEFIDEKKKDTPVRGFYMSKTEVTNLEYRSFLLSLKEQGREREWEEAQLDKNVWTKGRPQNEPFVNTYDNHPAYDNYPVVGVSKKGAEMYCKWLTEEWKKVEKRPKKMTGIELNFRLPTKTEWMYAAQGESEKMTPFPWGYYMRNNKGQILANFLRINDTKILYHHDSDSYEVTSGPAFEGIPGSKNLGEYAHITAPVVAYMPNDYGLYNICGNVSEMILDGGTKGGSWRSSGYYLQIRAKEEFPNLNGKPSRYVGFRPIAEIK